MARWGVAQGTWSLFDRHATIQRMKKRTGVRAWIFYTVVRATLAVLSAFPIDWNLKSARLLARLWIRFVPRHRNRALDHLTSSLGEQYTPEQLREIAERSLESLVMFVFEVISMPRLITMSTWPRRIRLVNTKEFIGLLLGGKGAILVTGHFGSFELIGHMLAALGFPTAAVMRPLDNVYLNRFLVRTRRLRGLTLLDKKGAASKVEEILRSGMLVGFIGDQDAGRKGLFVDFFGRPASTYKSIGLLAMQTRRPIVVGYARRRGHDARYEFGVQRIIHPRDWEHQDDPLRWITESFTSSIESFVRSWPDQYLWVHRRWKSRPGTRRRPPLVDPSTAQF